MRDDLEKQVNNSIKLMPLKTITRYLTLAILLFSCFSFQAQDFNQGKKYTIAEISVSGKTTFSEQTIVAYSGLKKDQEIFIPGEEISNAIKKLWNSNLFNNIDIYLLKTEGDKAYLEIRLEDLPELEEVRIEGVKKGKKDDIIKDNKLTKGNKVTENLITTTKNYLTNKYRKEGYLNTKVSVVTHPVEDSIQKSRVNMVVRIDKGSKVKVKDIEFEGNEVFSDGKLKKTLKNTKQKNFFRLWKRSKYIEADYKDDLNSLVDKYKENGYRDARILSDSLVYNDDKTVNLRINLEEGEQYTFGKISFVGNSVYSDLQLSRMLGIKEGDTYNGVLLNKRIADDTKPDGDDLTNLYQDSGYLFSSINAVEVSAEGNVIDLEIRITEGNPAYFNNISVIGNDKTNDHVIYRELRTRPGQLYKKSDVIRTIRELSQLGFFDAEQIAPNFKNLNPDEGTLDMEYSVVETGSSQIELQGGYGGGGFIGTLGLSFNNFSVKDIFKKDAYKPIPMGDGQKLALRLQASRFYQTYSFSFTEPWLGGKKPVQFSTSLSHTRQFGYNYQTRKADKSQSFNITGLTVGLAKRLNVPDNYFTLSQAISYQYYDINNYRNGLFSYDKGYSNNLSYTIALNRNDTWNDPIYPLGGSNFTISAKLSLPYSLFNNVDYKAMSEQRADLEEEFPTATPLRQSQINDEIGEIDQERFKWLEFYKIKFKADWYTQLAKKLVLRPSIEFGFLGAYNKYRGVIPFERFYLGGDGLGTYSLDGREAIALRGYPNQSLVPVDENNQSIDGASIYNKFSLELRYPISLKPAAKIFVLGFLEAGASYNNFKDYNPFDLHRSSGGGLRIFMPAFGLLGIDFGYGFDALPGQTRKNGWETHFIIGQQF